MYKQLTDPQRYQIYTLLSNDFNQSEIADQLSVSASTISLELKRKGLRLPSKAGSGKGTGASSQPKETDQDDR